MGQVIKVTECNNEGELVFEYNLEDTDSVNGDQVYNGQSSVLWNNIRDAFADELTAMYKRLRAGRLFNYAAIRQRSRQHQTVWPKRMWNEDAYNKYLVPFIQNGTDNLAMLQGDKDSQQDWWLYHGFKYRDSKRNTGDALTNSITIRGYTDDSHPISNQSITLTAYQHLYGMVDYASSYKVSHRMTRNETKVFANPMVNMWDTEIYIRSADCLADVGDLSPMNLGSADFSAATKLNRLIIGSSAVGYENTHLNSLTVGNNELLTLINVCNCKALTSTLNLANCSSIETVLATGSAITGVDLPIGGHLQRLELPETVTSLTVRNQSNMTTFVMEGYTALSTLRIENTPNIPIEAIINGATNLGWVRLTGIEWNATNNASLEATIDKLDTCYGLDVDAQSVAKPVVNARVHISAIDAELLERIQDNYPGLVVVVNGAPQYVVHYVNYDNSKVYNQVIPEGGDATDPVAGGLVAAPTRPSEQSGDITYAFRDWGVLPTNIHENKTIVAYYTPSFAVKYVNYDSTVLQRTMVVQNGSVSYTGSTPTKPSTAQYTYAFKDWSGADNANTGAIGQVTTVKTVTATYTQTVRTYTVKFYAQDRSTVLQTSTVEYGGSATYTGTTPTHPDGYEFDTWDPSPTNIQADTNCYPKFISPVVDEEIADTWDTIIDNLIGGTYSSYKVGNYRSMDVGSEGPVNMQIVAIDGEEGPLTFVAKELLATFKQMNSSKTNANGYPATDVMKPYLVNTIMPLLPEIVRKHLKAVPKKSYDRTTGSDLTSNEKLCIPSYREIFGGTSMEKSGPIYSIVYKNSASRIKNRNGSANEWWLRSANSSYDAPFRCVDSSGDEYNAIANYNRGVCLNFTLSPETISDSWEEIIAAIANNTYKTKYAVGDSKAVDLGDQGVIVFQIAAFDADPLASGSGTAAITWVAQRLLVTTKQMNSSSTSANGYPASNVLRPYLINTILPRFPEVLRNNMQEVTKYSYNKTTSGDITSTEKLCIPSYREVFGGTNLESHGPVYSGLFTNQMSRIRRRYGYTSGDAWWLRSAHKSDNAYFKGVITYGADSGDTNARYPAGVCLEFFLGVTPAS